MIITKVDVDVAKLAMQRAHHAYISALDRQHPKMGARYLAYARHRREYERTLRAFMEQRL